MSGRLSRRAFSSTLIAGSLIGSGSGKELLAQSATPVPEAGLQLALDALPTLAQSMLDSTGVPGLAIAVVHNDQVVYTEGFGVREVGTDTPVGPDTVFQIASVSKPVSSTVMAAAMGARQLTWDTKLADIMPEFSLIDPWVTANVTLADLFSHRSGLPDHAGDDLEDLGGNREQVLHALRYIELEGAFRDSYAYTNFGLTAAAEGVARAMDMEWHELGEQMLFAPAGMTQTSFLHSDFVAREDRAVGHVQQDGTWVHAFDRQPDAQAPAGGVSSSVRDLSQFMRLQLRDGILDGEELAESTALGTTHLPHAMSGLQDPPFRRMPSFYGLGWNVNYDKTGTVTLGHSGAFLYGAATALYLWPAEDLGIVVLTNGAPVGLPESVCLAFHDLYRFGEPAMDYLAVLGPYMQAELEPRYGSDVANPPVDPDPPPDLTSYVGEYWNDVYGTLDISIADGELVMTLGPVDLEFGLVHFNRDVFTYVPIGENAGATSAVTFTIAANGLSSQVVVENLNLYNAGTFTRQ